MGRHLVYVIVISVASFIITTYGTPAVSLTW